ncbi:hypothetical protein [Streptomyces natalensis]|uniref:hypothetical protein n=1 Tax=Streptomyces natalensis TaxID=68242 RepID=UPI000AB83E29|nr:hypothetical protein [Streptomyces natalensis]
MLLGAGPLFGIIQPAACVITAIAPGRLGLEIGSRHERGLSHASGVGIDVHIMDNFDSKVRCIRNG